jgi:hypothetical protein
MHRFVCRVEDSGSTTLHDTPTPKHLITAFHFLALFVILYHNSAIDIMADTNEEHNHDNGPISPNTVARLRTAIANTPRQSTSVLVTALLTVCPALLTGPLLALLGFGGLGPAAGKHLQSLLAF